MAYGISALIVGAVLFGAVSAPAGAVTPNVVVTYSYDTDGRVQTVGYDNTVSGATTCIVYSYDLNGNRLTQSNSSLAEPACAASAMTPPTRDGAPAAATGPGPRESPAAPSPDAPAPASR